LQQLKYKPEIRPCYWHTRCAKIPKELAHLHFAKLDMTGWTKCEKAELVDI
jgi:hypothetical protein